MPDVTVGASPASPAATVGSAHSGSGMIFSVRIGESKIGIVLVKPPAAPTDNAVLSPKLEGDGAAGQGAEWDRPPHEEAHHRVHPTLHSLRRDCLAQ